MLLHRFLRLGAVVLPVALLLMLLVFAFSGNNPQHTDDESRNSVSPREASPEQAESKADNSRLTPVRQDAANANSDPDSFDGIVDILRRDGLDLVLSFDSTGSMPGEISELKRRIEQTGKSLMKLIPGTRISICTYRDEQEDYVVKGLPLTGDIQAVMSYLDEIEARGGGDAPEAVQEGIRWPVDNNRFRPNARKVILLFGDAPPHQQDNELCLELAKDFAVRQEGIIHTVTCRREDRLPEFVKIAGAGGGEALLTSSDSEIMTQILVLIFGTKHRNRVLEEFGLLGTAVSEVSLLTNSIGMKLTLIPAGEFVMGSPKSETSREDDEGQDGPHRVRISKPYYLGVYEVTQGEYEATMGSHSSYFSSRPNYTSDGKDRVSGKDTSRFPVEMVSWYDAVEFCNKLSEREGLTPYYTLRSASRLLGRITNADVAVAGGKGYRLPTEAEWEYACRAGTTSAFHFGDVSNGRDANIDGNAPYGTTTKGPYLERTATVGSYTANQFGLFDMHGNVYEWCEDWYDENFYERAPGEEPVNRTAATSRVLRGGAWHIDAKNTRSACRTKYRPNGVGHYFGFRAARTP